MLNEIWVTLFTLIKSITGDVDVKNKGTLQKQIDDCFQSASEGKQMVADAVTGKGVLTKATDTFATIAANIKNIKTSPNLQAKNAALSTSAQTIKPDTGYDGLSQVSVPAVSGTAGAGDVLSGKTFSSGSAGISKTGTMANKGAWTGATTGNSKVTIPAGYHNGSGYVDGAGAYSAGMTAADARTNTDSANYKAGYNAGVSAADARANTDSANYKAGYNAGVSAADARTNVNSANYKGGYNAGVSATKVGTAGTGDVLSGKTFTNSSSVGSGGTMANKGGTTVDAGAVTQDDNYTYLSVPANGYYNTNSKIRAQNSNIGSVLNTITEGTTAGKSHSVTIGKHYLLVRPATKQVYTNKDTFTGCDIKYSKIGTQAVEGIPVSDRTLIVKATAATITCSAAYYCTQIT